MTSSALPFVQVTSVDVNGNFVGPGPGSIIVHSPGNGVMATAGNFALAEHDTCSPGAACEVSLEDDRLTSVVLQIGNDGDHYLLTSFHAGDSTNNTVQALYFVGQVESFAGDPNGVGQWNGWYFDGRNFWAGYPTITMDDDFDIVSSFQTFYLNSNIYPNWYLDKGFIPNNNTFAQNPPSLGYGILGNASRSAYYGGTNCTSPGPSPQRWGDYMSTMWDSDLGSPDESSGFWTVQEYSNGGPSASPTPLGSNESTQITMLADPPPWFVGYNLPTPPTGEGPAGGGEDECTHGTGYNCNLTYSAPSGAQFGDVFVVVQAVGDTQNDTFMTLPTGWTKLQYEGGSHTLYANNGDGFTQSIYTAIYVYGSQPNDTGQYEFQILPQVNGAETDGFLVAYRGASTDIPGDYLLYGNAVPGNNPKVITPTLSPGNKDSPPTESVLLNIFNTECIGADDPDTFGTFGSPSGSPFAIVETPLNSLDGFFAADVLVTTSGGTFGPYKSATGCSGGTGLNTGISLVIPE